MKIKPVLVLSIIIFFKFSSCKSQKIIQKKNDFSRSIKFIPESEKFKFKLTQKKNMPFSEYDFGAELYNGKIYAFLDNHRNRYGTEDYNHGDVCVYDIDKNSWCKINVIPKSQPTTTSVLVNDKIYLIGASENNGDLIQVYNISKNEWEESLKLPIGLYWTTVETYNQCIYVMGGYCPQLHPKTEFLDTVQIYDTTKKEWSFGTPSPRPIHSPNSLKFNNEFYTWDSYYNVFFKYNPIKNKWTNLEELKPFVKGFQKGIVYKNNFLFIAGTDIDYVKKSSKVSRKIYLYNTKTGEYIESKSNLIKEIIYNFKVFNYKNNIYILGGRGTQKDWPPMNDVIKLEIN